MNSKRKLLGCIFLLCAGLIWIPSGDVVDMIIRNKEIVLGRYSRGHFGGLFFLTLIFIGIAALCFSKIKTVGEMVLVGILVAVSVFVSGFVLIIGSGWAVQPRYVETVVEGKEDGKKVKGLVRHRPANEFYELKQIDKPEQLRSYPNAPAGYPGFELTLTSDKFGFRNLEPLLEEYPIVAVGDSFVASSHVSDQQAWVALVAEELHEPIYNLGVSGSDPGTYYNNFMLLGKKLKPKKVIFMLYEGNDFKKISPLMAGQTKSAEKTEKKLAKKKQSGKTFAYYIDASPVKKGINRFSAEVLEAIGKNNPVPEYQQAVGFMPLKFSTEKDDHFYSFEPKRLTYLYEEKEAFSQSSSWKQIAFIMDDLVADGKEEGFEMYFVYAPSTPHVVMPLMKDQIPADQLYRFMAYEDEGLPEAEILKQHVFDGMDNEQQVFEDHCKARAMNCLSLTSALQRATLAGQQLYYTYDQHWTPEGNQVVADTLSQWLANTSLDKHAPAESLY